MLFTSNFNSFINGQIIVINNNECFIIGFAIYFNTTGKAVAYINGANSITSSSSFSANTWHHIALVRNSNLFTLYVNGNSVGTFTEGKNMTDNALTIGSAVDHRANTSDFKMNGYIDEIRITKGIARYTANFTPPTAQFPDQ